MTSAVLDSYLRPAGTFDLVRLGRDNDGGYLVDRRDVLGATSLVALGINDDWTFEADFLAINEVPLHAVDGTVSPKVFVRRAVRDLAIAHSPAESLRALRDYRRFFSGTRVHHRVMVGVNSPPSAVPLRDLLAAHTSDVDNVFIKVDIEGWEYRILDDIVDHRDRIAGLVIEFHDFDLHQDRIRDFLQRLGMRIAHVHCNNYTPIVDSGTPTTVEVTLTGQEPIASGVADLPHADDQPNNPNVPEVRIAFD